MIILDTTYIVTFKGDKVLCGYIPNHKYCAKVYKHEYCYIIESIEDITIEEDVNHVLRLASEKSVRSYFDIEESNEIQHEELESK